MELEMLFHKQSVDIFNIGIKDRPKWKGLNQGVQIASKIRILGHSLHVVWKANNIISVVEME